MKSSVATKNRQNVNQLTIGIDLGDRWGHYCILDEHGEVLEEGRVPMTRKALTAQFSDVPARIAMEAGAYSAWISEHLSAMGHEVIMANARELRAISGSNNKNDRADAEKLARFARVDPKILVLFSTDRLPHNSISPSSAHEPQRSAPVLWLSTRCEVWSSPSAAG